MMMSRAGITSDRGKGFVLAYFVGMMFTVIAFVATMYVVDRNAIARHEAMFNKQQSLQTFLVKQSIQAKADEIVRMSILLAGMFTRGLNHAGPGWTGEVGMPRPVNGSDSAIVGQVAVTCDGVVKFAEFAEGSDAALLTGLARNWAARGRLALKGKDREYVIPPFYATESAQFMGVVIPVPPKSGRCLGTVVMLADLGPLLDRYVKPMRSGRYGAGYVLDDAGTIVYDHESQIIGQNVFAGMHDGYPSLLAVDRRLVGELSGVDSYSFTVKRGGAVSRKLIAWNAATVGGRRLVICLSAPDKEINETLGFVRSNNLILGGVLGVVLIFISVALYRRRGTDELVRSERLFRQFSDATFEGIVIHSDHEIIEGNKQFWDMIGYEPGDLSGPGGVMIPVAEECRDEVEKRMEADDFSPYETIFRRRDGSTFPADVRLKKMEYQGRPVRVAAIRDITERRRAEEEMASFNAQLSEQVRERTRDLAEKNAALEEANRRLQGLDDLKSSFLSTVSHELRTPLTSILGFAKIISREFKKVFVPLCPDDPATVKKVDRIQKNLEVIVQEGNRLTRLVDDVLDLSRIEDDRMQWNDEAVSIAGLVSQATGVAEGLFADKPISFSISLEDDLPEVLADKDRLHQVLLNLLTNAAKFTREGGVAISAERRPGAGVCIRVEDTGPGISPEDRESIFSKFHQARHGDTLSGRERGTGLGLAISKNIVEHYGGTIRVESELGQGSVFIVELPRDIEVRDIEA